MQRLHLTVLTTRNKTLKSDGCEKGFPSFKTQIYAFSPLHKHDLDDTKILLYKLIVRYLVVKPACVNAALLVHIQILNRFF